MSIFLQKNPIIKNYKIYGVVCSEDCIEISFYDTEVTLNMIPEGDCCSRNWFEDFGELENLKDQYIVTIDENPFYANEEDPVDECDETRIIYINNFTFKFRHTCNGYYSGWIDYKLIPCDEINY